MNSCYCENKEHEICYDGIIGTYDENCECCKDTNKIINEIDDAYGAIYKHIKTNQESELDE